MPFSQGSFAGHSTDINNTDDWFETGGVQMVLIKQCSIPSPCKHRDFWTLAKVCPVIDDIDWSRGAVTK